MHTQPTLFCGEEERKEVAGGGREEGGGLTGPICERRRRIRGEEEERRELLDLNVAKRSDESCLSLSFFFKFISGHSLSFFRLSNIDIITPLI